MCYFAQKVAAWHSGSTLVSINVVTQVEGNTVWSSMASDAP